MANLNEEQRRAVEKAYGPVLVLAGPGSGKTFTLVERIKYMIEKEGISPGEILVITFSKKASINMQDRFNKHIANKSYPVNFGTFHAIFFSIVKQYYKLDRDSILTEKRKKEYLKLVLNRLKYNAKDEIYLEELINDISLLKSSDNIEDEGLAFSIEMDNINELKKIYDEYSKLCKKNKKIDFDDMLYLCRELFLKRPEVLAKYQKIYKYILIDEFQDINKVQYDVLRMLSSRSGNVFAVGDDDQSIYGFRGSKPELMKQFIEDYNCKEIINLTINYRSSECIIEKAKRLIVHNKSRIEKTQIAAKNNTEKGQVIINICNNVNSEVTYVFDEIIKLKEQGSDLSDVAILFRTISCAYNLIEKFRIYGIPFALSNTMESYYKSEWMQDIMAFFSAAILLKNNANGEQVYNILAKIIHKPRRNLFLEEIVENGGLKNITKTEYKSFYNRIISLSGMNGFAAINFIFKGLNYESYFFEIMERKGYSKEKIQDLMMDIYELSRKYDSIKEWLEDSKIESSNENNKTLKEHSSCNNKLSLLTAHASKGLEFETVFVIGLQEGIFPHNRCKRDEDMEEERRLLYVAMTRAKKKLYIIGRGEEKHGKKISRFIDEII